MHIHSEDYHCKKCNTVYIPFKPEAACPKCGEKPNDDVNEYYNFVQKVAGVMRMHKRNFGRFFPDGWFSHTFDSHVQRDAFRIFDYMETEKPADEELFIRSLIEKNWGGLEHLKNRTIEIMLAINAEYKLDPPPESPNLEVDLEPEMPTRLTLLQKIKRFWSTLAP